MIGLIAVLVVGVAVIAYGAVHDRNRIRRATAEMLSPPDRAIPGYAAESGPHYVSELQARRPPTDAAHPVLSDSERETVREELSAASTLTVPAGYLSKDFVTDATSGWAVLPAPQVLVCADKVQTVRELLGALAGHGPTGVPLVVVAPAYGVDVRATLEVNVIQRRLSLLAVVADSDAATRIAAATGATAVARRDLQAGYLAPESLGGCRRWVATKDRSHIIGGDAA